MELEKFLKNPQSSIEKSLNSNVKKCDNAVRVHCIMAVVK